MSICQRIKTQADLKQQSERLLDIFSQNPILLERFGFEFAIKLGSYACSGKYLAKLDSFLQYTGYADSTINFLKAEKNRVEKTSPCLRCYFASKK